MLSSMATPRLATFSRRIYNMCFGGSDDDSDSGGETDREKTNRFDRQKNVTLRDYEKRGVNQTDPIQSDNPGRDFETGKAYAENQAKLEGYGQNNKGVVDNEGNAILDGFGNPVQSGEYSNIMDNSESSHENSMAYNDARVIAEANWLKSQKAAKSSVSPAVIAAGLGTNPNALKDGYTLENAAFGNTPATEKQRQAYAKMLAEAMRASYLGTDVRRFPGATFDDPLGTALGSTLSSTYLGSDLSTKQQRANFGALSKAYNRGPFRSKLEADAAGNVGTTTWAQRFGTGFGNMIEGLVLGSVLGPAGSILGTGTNYETMNTYGARVPDWEGTASTSSFNYGSALGGALGDFAAGKAAPYVGQKIYDSTGSVGQATTAAVATGVGLTEGIGSYVGGKMQDVAPGIMSSDIKSPYEARTQQQKNQEEAGGFGASLNDGPDNSSVATPAPRETPAISTLQNTGLSDTSGDVAAGSPDFDWEAWLLANAKNANPNSVQPTSLSGQPTISASNNPLFSAQPDMNGVRYLQQGGTNRNYGTARLQPVNSMQQARSRRRTGLNDKRIGVVIG